MHENVNTTAISPGQVWEIDRVKLRVVERLSDDARGGFWQCLIVDEPDHRRATVRVHGATLTRLGKLVVMA